MTIGPLGSCLSSEAWKWSPDLATHALKTLALLGSDFWVDGEMGKNRSGKTSPGKPEIFWEGGIRGLPRESRGTKWVVGSHHFMHFYEGKPP